MFQFKRKAVSTFTQITHAEFSARASQIGSFAALVEALSSFQPGFDPNWIFNEIMRAYPDPNENSPELHLLMGMYLQKTDAPVAASIEFDRAGAALTDLHLPNFNRTQPHISNVRPANNKTGLIASDLSDQDLEIRLNEHLEAWALDGILREHAQSTSPARQLFSGLLTARNFPQTSAKNLVFVAISIVDETLLTPSRLSVLQKAAPILVRDQATKTLLDHFEVSNYLIGPASAAVSLAPINPRPDSVAWVAIEQWANDEITKISAAELIEKPHRLARKVQKILRFQTVKTSIPAIAQFCINQNRNVEFKPKPKMRPFVSNYPQNPSAQNEISQIYQQIIPALIDSKINFTQALFELSEPNIVAIAQPLPNSSLAPNCAAEVRELRTTISTKPKSERHLHLAFGFDQNLLNYFEPVLLEIQANASFSADIHVLGRGFKAEQLIPIVEQFPYFTFHFYPFDSVDYGPQINTLEHITVSTMDRLLLAELLPEVDQLIYLDTDLMVFEDLWELGKVKLGSHALGARLIKTTVWGSAYKTFHKAAAKLPMDFVDTLRATLIQDYHLLETKMVNAGVLIMNLRLMRTEKFLERFIGLVEFARFNDQDVLSLWAAGRIYELETSWNWTISQTEIVKPKILHWAGPRKPWKSEYVWYQSEFEKYLSDSTPLN